MQNLDERVKELDGQLRLSDTKCSDYKDDVERLKRDLAKAESIESELRRSIDQQSRTSHDYQLLRDQVSLRI